MVSRNVAPQKLKRITQDNFAEFKHFIEIHDIFKSAVAQKWKG